MISLALGTNIGDKKQNLATALEKLAIHFTIIKKSSVYQSEPWGESDQEDFLNQVVIIETDKTPEALLQTTQSIEKEMGKTKTSKYGPRLIDIDILYYNNKIIESDSLTIPHPRISERNFVLTPLNEINPEFIDPTQNVSIKHLLDKCQDTLCCKTQTL